jgi:flagellar basal body-associated protein FliL
VEESYEKGKGPQRAVEPMMMTMIMIVIMIMTIMAMMMMMISSHSATIRA